MRDIDWLSWILVSAAIVAGLALIVLVNGCGHARPRAPVVTPPPLERPGAVFDNRPIAKNVSGAHADVDRLRAELASAEAREYAAEQRERQREADEQRRIAQAQAKYATWIAGIVFLGSIVYTVAAFAFGLPKRLGAVIGGGSVALLVGARAWSWLADKALIAALLLVGIGALVGVWMLIRYAMAGRTGFALADDLEHAETEAEVIAAKAKAKASQVAQGLHGLVQHLRRRKATP